MFDHLVDGTKNNTNDSSDSGERRFVVTLRPTTTEVEDGAPDYFAPLRGFMMMANIEGDWEGAPVGEWDVHDDGTDAGKLAQVHLVSFIRDTVKLRLEASKENIPYKLLSKCHYFD